MAEEIPISHPSQLLKHRYVFTNMTFDQLTYDRVLWNTASDFEYSTLKQIIPEDLQVNQGLFTHPVALSANQQVSIIQQDPQLVLFCSCEGHEEKLCHHQAQVLISILKRDEFRIFFSQGLRQQKLRPFARDYGLENEPQLDLLFLTSYQNGQVVFTPRQAGFIPVNREILTGLKETILHPTTLSETSPGNQATRTPNLVVFRTHKYYHYLLVELYTATLSKDGKPKNPLTPVKPMDSIWNYSDTNDLKFFISVAQFQNRMESNMSESDMLALRAIIKNPLACGLYVHQTAISEKVNANSITAVKLEVQPQDVLLQVTRKELYYELSGQLILNEKIFELRNLPLKFGCFIWDSDTLYLVDNLAILGVIDLFKKNPDNLLIHSSKFKEFKVHFLDSIEDKIRINYSFIQTATPAQIREQNFNTDPEPIIFLSDLGDFVKIIPVVRYGEIEIGVRTKRNIYGIDDLGNEFLVARDIEVELRLTNILIRHHPYFQEQLENELEYFYLHRKHFLNEDWFLQTFEAWREAGISILGFNDLRGNKLNPHPVKISVRVLSGINWFNSLVRVQFGKRKASLKKVHIAVRSKSKYVQLDDGTLGILPEEWIEKFAGYFNAGEITGEETIATPAINFSTIRQLYDEAMLGEDVKNELKEYHNKFADFKTIKEVPVPNALKGTLRPYQREGLNWLNFLDDFNFGGCLADDMGLGKSVQIIAFILLQRNKVKNNCNLLVVPTTLIFNWKAEIEKFAPSLKVYTIQGADRIKNTVGFDGFEVILISYATLLSDINYLRKYQFNYIFLDESQNIKNPDTQRYRAVQLLQSRNKIAITGTPVENNTFDLFSQFSFACPGLLGSAQYFRAIYSIPVDKFKNSQRAGELREKIRPFLLRRTKNQVAADLPPKTEMVLYCDMNDTQRKIYDSYEKEFRDYISASDNEELKKNSMHVLKGLTRLRQICNSPKLIGEDMPDETGSSKMEMLLEQIEDHAAHHKMLIFSQFVSMLDLIRVELIQREIPFVMLTGATKNRQVLVEEFQNNPATRIFLISLKAGGTGLNLTEADYVYLVDPWWNPAVENQAIDRTHRIGQNKNVTAIRLICPDTVEEKIIKLQQNKIELTNSLIRADASFFQILSKDDLLGLLGE